ncbi:hypothetical protein D3C77_783620 [compost metagenome]
MLRSIFGVINFESWSKIYSENESQTLQQALDLKADVTEAGYNLVFSNSSRLLKMYNKNGGLMAQVTIPVGTPST